MIPPSCSFLALPHLQIFKLDFSDLFSKTPTVTAWSAVLAYSLVMIFDIGECCCIGFFLRASAVGHGTHTHTHGHIAAAVVAVPICASKTTAAPLRQGLQLQPGLSIFLPSRLFACLPSCLPASGLPAFARAPNCHPACLLTASWLPAGAASDYALQVAPCLALATWQA